MVLQGCKDDYTKTCPGQTDVEYRTEFSMWAIMASSLLVATDIKNMSDAKREVGYFLTAIPTVLAIALQIILNKEIIAVNQDSLGNYSYLCLCTLNFQNIRTSIQGKLVIGLVGGTAVK